MWSVGRQFIVVMGVLAATVAAYWPAVHSLVNSWADVNVRTYRHGYLVAAVSLWLLWQARGRIAAAPVLPCWPAVLVVVAAGAFWYVAWASGIQVLSEALLPIVMFSAVTAVGGLVSARACGFAIGYLYFAIPVWSFINGSLQSLTTAAVTLVLRITGMPVYVEGNFVHVPVGTFEIAGGCSGLHFVIVALAIASLQGEVERVGLRTRLALLVIAATMSVIANWVRVYVVILNGYLTDMRGHLVHDHYTFGWILFALMMAMYFWLSRLLLARVPLAEAGEAQQPVAATLAWPAVALTLTAIGVGPALASIAERHARAGPVSVALPAGAGGWHGPLPADTQWKPRYPAADGSALATYRRDGRAVEVYVNLYRRQGQGHELVGYDNDLLQGLGSGYAVSTMLVVGDRRVDGELASKLYYALDVLRRPTPSGIVAVAVRCDADCDSAAGAADEFLGRHADELAAAITGSVETK